ncbi:50S ribosomal protein L24 [bacterium]|nr:MAG: 50S ribosomal protein L24 [bacterium]
MRIRKNDNVMVIAGKDKGKSGKVIKSVISNEKVVVDKVNIAKKHMKSQYEGKKGEIIEKPMPLHISNVKLICPKCGKPTKVGSRKIESGKNIRVCKKCKEDINEELRIKN